MNTIKKNTWISLAITAILFLFTILLYDITYWLNDDVMIESILSGSFTGSPEAMTYYFSVPLGFIISTLYKLIPVIPWFSCFFIAVYLLCFYLITKRFLSITSSYNSKQLSSILILLTGISFLYIAVFLPNVVLLHYTLLAAIAGGTGLFLVVTRQKSLIVPIILMLLCYMIRENVFFMLMPFFAVTGLYCLIREGIKSLKTYLIALGIFILSFVIIYAANKLPYCTNEWKDYVEYNKARTTLYDFVTISTSDEAVNFYESQGIDTDTYNLYRSYNLMLTDRDISLLNKFSDYNNVKYQDRSTLKHLKDAVYVYVKSLYSNKDFWPLNPVIFALYIICAIALIRSNKLQLIVLAALFAARSMLWTYLFWNDRYPERVTYSLLYIELLILIGILINTARSLKSISLNNSLVMLTLVLSLILAYYTMPGFQSDYDTLNESNSVDNVLYDYINNNPDNFYLIDVFASVNRTHKAFIKTPAKENNYLMLGGWMVDSPLTNKKLTHQNVSAVSELITRDNVYVILKSNMYNNITIKDYEAWLNTDFECIDSLVVNETTTFLIYSVTK